MKSSMLLALLAALTVSLAMQGEVCAQQSDDEPAKGVYVGPYLEIAGAGGLYSINVEATGQYWGARAGFSAGAWFNSFPILAFGMLGSRKHKIEAGGGVLVVTAGADDESSGISLSGSGAAGVIAVGYRYQAESGFFTKVTATPLIAGGETFLWAGFGFGWRF